MKAVKFVLAIILIGFFLTPARGQGQGGGSNNIVSVLRKMFPRARIEVDPLTSTLLVTASPSLQKKIGEMIKRLDVYHPQVTIEAKFVELSVNNIDELGVQMNLPNIIMSEVNQAKMKIATTWADSDGGFPANEAAWGLWYSRVSNTAFNAVLRALEKEKKANVLSAPEVTTLNGQTATIEITQTIPYVSAVTIQQATTTGAKRQVNYTIKEKDAGITLQVTPHVPEGSTLITLDIKPDVRELVDQLDMFKGSDVPPDLGWPVIDERTTNTTMIIDSGETVVLGGLIRNFKQVIDKKIPLLGDIPLLGYAFRHKYSTNEKRNLLIFITAYLLSPSGEKTVARR
jgi:general secretion pathway protein D